MKRLSVHRAALRGVAGQGEESKRAEGLLDEGRPPEFSVRGHVPW